MPKSYPTGFQMIEGNDVNQVANQAFGYQDNITARSGGGLAGAPVLSAGLNRVATAAADGDSIALPAAVANPANGNAQFLVRNDSAHSVNVEPQSTDQINRGGAGTAFAVASGKSCLFFCAGTGNWSALLSA